MIEITQHDAREALEKWIECQTGGVNIILPYYDVVVAQNKDITNNIYEDVTFRHLIKIAYNLKDAE